MDTDDKETRLGMLVDKPGGGKTVVMAQLLHALESKSTTVLTLKSDYLSGIKSKTALQNRLNLPISVEDSVRLLASKQRVIVLIDQIDALSIALSQDFETLDLIYSLVLEVSHIENVRIVVSCREFDLRFDPKLSTFENRGYRKFTLAPLTSDQVDTVLISLGLESRLPLNSRMLQLLSTPLHLRIFVDLLLSNKEAISEEVSSLQQLYDYLWSKQISSTSMPHVVGAINVLVKEMQKQRQLSAPDSLLDDEIYKRARDYLQSINFIRKERQNFVFSHQTLFDYCYVRYFIAQGSSISNVIFASPQGLFERSQMLQVLAYIRVANPDNYIRELNALLFAGKLRIHLRYLLIQWLASVGDPNEDERVIAGILLQDPHDQDEFVTALRGNVKWFDRLNDGFVESLLHSGDERKITLTTINYLCSLVNDRTHEILSLLLPYQRGSQTWISTILRCLTFLEDWKD